jgi:hypothetical protein
MSSTLVSSGIEVAEKISIFLVDELGMVSA